MLHHPPPTTATMSSKTGQATDANDLFNELRKVYWESIQKEARNMIEFYAHLCSSADLTLKPEVDLDLCCESFKKIFDVWSILNTFNAYEYSGLELTAIKWAASLGLTKVPCPNYMKRLLNPREVCLGNHTFCPLV